MWQSLWISRLLCLETETPLGTLLLLSSKVLVAFARVWARPSWEEQQPSVDICWPRHRHSVGTGTCSFSKMLAVLEFGELCSGEFGEEQYPLLGRWEVEIWIA